MKNNILWLATVTALLVACERAAEPPTTTTADHSRRETRAATLDHFYRMATVEPNNVDPRNAGEYRLTDDTQFFTHIALWGATIGGDNRNRVSLSLTDYLNAVLNDPGKYIEPLQAKGIKVLLWIEGNRSGAGFSNLTAEQIDTFTDALTAYDSVVDGYFLNDEWASYGINGWPIANQTSYSELILALRQKTDKMLCVYDFGYSSWLSQQASDCIERGCYGVINGYSASPGFEIPLSRYCPYCVDLEAPPSYSTVRARTLISINHNAGGIFFEKVPADTTRLSTFRAVASAFGLSCTHTGKTYR